ncbi:MAG: ABC transporter permease [Clostridia bacterium]|nr:ABC transporter permease [Clostridia bacterium]
MFAIYKKELRSYFINPIGYVFVGVFLAVAALLCCYTTLKANTYNTSSYFSFLIMAFVILIPLLTMRLFAEERKLRTEQLLMTAPVSITSVVLGKYLAAFTVFMGALLVSCVNFIPLYVIADRERAGEAYSELNIGPVTSEIVGSLIGIILIGAAFIAIGMFISSLTEDHLAAAIGTIGIILFMVIMGFVNSMTDAEGNQIISNYALRFVIDWISVMSRFYNFGYGIFDFAALLYYLSLAGVFIFLTVRVYDKRRWG